MKTINIKERFINNNNNNLLKQKLLVMESERYTYVTKNGITVLFQRLSNNFMWYAISSNQIVNWGQYRLDLEEWCDMAL